jgi:hypothetical protein
MISPFGENGGPVTRACSNPTMEARGHAKRATAHGPDIKPATPQRLESLTGQKCFFRPEPRAGSVPVAKVTVKSHAIHVHLCQCLFRPSPTGTFPIIQ